MSYISKKTESVLKIISPMDTTFHRFGLNCCEYRDKDRDLIILVRFTEEEINGKNCLVLCSIKVGMNYLGKGICKDLLKNLVNTYDGAIVLGDVVSSKIYNILNKYFKYTKLDRPKDTSINETWVHYDDYYGSFKLDAVKE